MTMRKGIYIKGGLTPEQLIANKSKDIQKIIDLAVSGKSDDEVANQTGYTSGFVANTRKIFGVVRKIVSLNLEKDAKMISKSRFIIFSARNISSADFIEKSQYFKVVNVDNGKKTLTLSFR